jgi:hypothetical protein
MGLTYMSVSRARESHRRIVSSPICPRVLIWQEDNRRVSNGEQVNRIAALALKRGKSVDFTGYWQNTGGALWHLMNW